MVKKVKWGILGCGDVTEVKSGPAFSLVEGSELVAVMRRNAEKAKDYAKRHNVPKWYSSADDLINDDDVNAVYVATPPSSHAELTIKALKAGKPVYVEKPMALNYDQCKQMIEASVENETPLYVAYYRRALPGFVKVKELLEADSVGKVKLVNIHLHKDLSLKQDQELPWRVNPEIAGGGHFYDLASHQLDFIYFLFGATKEIQALAVNQTKQYKAEDTLVANFLLSNKIVVNGSWCFHVPKHIEKDFIEIIGEKGSLKISCFDFTQIELVTEAGLHTYDNPRPKHVQQPFIQLIVDQLLGKKELKPNALSASRTSWVLEKAVQEYY